MVTHSRPGEADDTPAIYDEADISLPVGFKTVADTMERPTVEFDGQFEIRPVSVQFALPAVDPQPLIRPRCGEPGISDELYKTLLELCPSRSSLLPHESAQLVDPTPSVASFEYIREFLSRHEPENVGLIAKTGHVACTEGGTKVHERPSRARDWKTKMFDHIVCQ